MNAQEIIEIMEKGEFCHYGIRACNHSIEKGLELRASYDWDYENDCESDDFLSGTCALMVHDYMDHDEVSAVLNSVSDYGENIALIGGDSMEHGQDEGETIIAGAVVVEVIG